MSWWQDGVIYHVYPRSFADADGDGVGDLRGLAGRLDHVRELGVDAVWLSPIYRSPMKDFGYDITDHTAIEPQFGTLEDFDALVDAAHARDLRLLLDFVPNHTSDEHPWFRGTPDWYLWSDRPAQQLDQRVRRAGVDARPRARAVLLPRLPARAAGPELAQPGAARGDARRPALLARPRRRRLPRRRAAPGAQGPGVARQPAEPRLPPGPAGVRPAPARAQRRPRRPRSGARDRGGDRRARRRDGRRAVPAVRAARCASTPRASICRRTCT